MLKSLKTKSAAPSSVSELLTAVDTHRDQIVALRDERAQVENAPRPLTEVMGDLDAHLDFLATASVDALALHRLRARGAAVELKATAPIALGLLVALNREAFRKIVADQIADLEQARPGLTEADRLARLAELDGEILRAEMSEEAAIRMLEHQGVSIARRADASPLAVLASDQALAG